MKEQRELIQNTLRLLTEGFINPNINTSTFKQDLFEVVENDLNNPDDRSNFLSLLAPSVEIAHELNERYSNIDDSNIVDRIIVACNAFPTILTDALIKINRKFYQNNPIEFLRFKISEGRFHNASILYILLSATMSGIAILKEHFKEACQQMVMDDLQVKPPFSSPNNKPGASGLAIILSLAEQGTGIETLTLLFPNSLQDVKKYLGEPIEDCFIRGLNIFWLLITNNLFSPTLPIFFSEFILNKNSEVKELRASYFKASYDNDEYLEGELKGFTALAILASSIDHLPFLCRLLDQVEDLENFNPADLLRPSITSIKGESIFCTLMRSKQGQDILSTYFKSCLSKIAVADLGKEKADALVTSLDIQGVIRFHAFVHDYKNTIIIVNPPNHTSPPSLEAQANDLRSNRNPAVFNPSFPKLVAQDEVLHQEIIKALKTLSLEEQTHFVQNSFSKLYSDDLFKKQKEQPICFFVALSETYYDEAIKWLSTNNKKKSAFCRNLSAYYLKDDTIEKLIGQNNHGLFLVALSEPLLISEELISRLCNYFIEHPNIEDAIYTRLIEETIKKADERHLKKLKSTFNKKNPLHTRINKRLESFNLAFSSENASSSTRPPKQNKKNSAKKKNKCTSKGKSTIEKKTPANFVEKKQQEEISSFDEQANTLFTNIKNIWYEDGEKNDNKDNLVWLNNFIALCEKATQQCKPNADTGREIEAWKIAAEKKIDSLSSKASERVTQDFAAEQLTSSPVTEELSYHNVSGQNNDCGLYALFLGMKLTLANKAWQQFIEENQLPDITPDEMNPEDNSEKLNLISAGMRTLLVEALKKDKTYKTNLFAHFNRCFTLLLEKRTLLNSLEKLEGNIAKRLNRSINKLKNPYDPSSIKLENFSAGSLLIGRTKLLALIKEKEDYLKQPIEDSEALYLSNQEILEEAVLTFQSLTFLHDSLPTELRVIDETSLSQLIKAFIDELEYEDENADRIKLFILTQLDSYEIHTACLLFQKAWEAMNEMGSPKKREIMKSSAVAWFYAKADKELNQDKEYSCLAYLAECQSILVGGDPHTNCANLFGRFFLTPRWESCYSNYLDHLQHRNVMKKSEEIIALAETLGINLNIHFSQANWNLASDHSSCPHTITLGNLGEHWVVIKTPVIPAPSPFDMAADFYREAFLAFIRRDEQMRKHFDELDLNIKNKICASLDEGIQAQAYLQALRTFIDTNDVMRCIFNTFSECGTLYCTGGAVRSMILAVVAAFFTSTLEKIAQDDAMTENNKNLIKNLLAYISSELPEEIHDYDFVINATTDEIKEHMRKIYDPQISPHIRFSQNRKHFITIRVNGKKNQHVDLCCANLPDEASIIMDLCKRDFTGSAVLVRRNKNGQVIILDPLKGIPDIILKVLRPITENLFIFEESETTDSQSVSVLRAAYFESNTNQRYNNQPALKEVPTPGGPLKLATREISTPKADDFLKLDHETALHHLGKFINRLSEDRLKLHKFYDFLTAYGFSVPDACYNTSHAVKEHASIIIKSTNALLSKNHLSFHFGSTASSIGMFSQNNNLSVGSSSSPLTDISC